MKKIFSFLFSLSLTFFLCQKIELKKVTDSSQIFKGEIAGNPITIKLNFSGIVDCHQYQHFVDGWYYYDKYKKKILLTGVYDLSNLYLYNFGSQQDKGSKFLHQKITNLQLVAKTDSIAKILKPKEILIFNSDYSTIKETMGSFHMENKTFPVKLFTKDTRIYRYNNYIILPNNKKINTYDFLNPLGGNKLISYASDKFGNRILLYFEELSNFNFCGMCGASDGEKGYRVLYFTKDWKYKNYKEFLIESCLENIYDVTKTTSKDKQTIQYKISKSDNTAAHLLTVDLKNASVMQAK